MLSGMVARERALLLVDDMFELSVRILAVLSEMPD